MGFSRRFDAVALIVAVAVFCFAASFNVQVASSDSHVPTDALKKAAPTGAADTIVPVALSASECKADENQIDTANQGDKITLTSKELAAAPGAGKCVSCFDTIQQLWNPTLNTRESRVVQVCKEVTENESEKLNEATKALAKACATSATNCKQELDQDKTLWRMTACNGGSGNCRQVEGFDTLTRQVVSNEFGQGIRTAFVEQQVYKGNLTIENYEAQLKKIETDLQGCTDFKCQQLLGEKASLESAVATRNQDLAKWTAELSDPTKVARIDPEPYDSMKGFTRPLAPEQIDPWKDKPQTTLGDPTPPTAGAAKQEASPEVKCGWFELECLSKKTQSFMSGAGSGPADNVDPVIADARSLVKEKESALAWERGTAGGIWNGIQNGFGVQETSLQRAERELTDAQAQLASVEAKRGPVDDNDPGTVGRTEPLYSWQGLKDGERGYVPEGQNDPGTTYTKADRESALGNLEDAMKRYQNAPQKSAEEDRALEDIKKYDRELAVNGVKVSTRRDGQLCSLNADGETETCTPTTPAGGAMPAEKAAELARLEAEREAALAKGAEAGKRAAAALNELNNAQVVWLRACTLQIKNGQAQDVDAAQCATAEARLAQARTKSDAAARAIPGALGDVGNKSIDADTARLNAEIARLRAGQYGGGPAGANNDLLRQLFGGGNQYGSGGLSQQDQQYLQWQCYTNRNPQACQMLQQAQNNNPLGQLGNLLKQLTGQGGQPGQGQGGTDPMMNQAMCGQYRGMQYVNGSCNCPQGSQWSGQGCEQSNSCQQYPGTTLVNGRCTCPQGKEWNGQQCGTGTGTGGTGSTPEALAAELSCAPQVVDDSDTPIAISWTCRGAGTSRGDGFSTGGQPNGSTEIRLSASDIENNNGLKNLILTCIKDGKTVIDQCPLTANAAFIAVVAVPSEVSANETTKIGWIVKGMAPGDNICNITSDKHPDFRITGRNKVITTPSITENTTFTIECTTGAGNTKEAKVPIKVR